MRRSQQLALSRRKRRQLRNDGGRAGLAHGNRDQLRSHRGLDLLHLHSSLRRDDLDLRLRTDEGARGRGRLLQEDGPRLLRSRGRLRHDGQERGRGRGLTQHDERTAVGLLNDDGAAGCARLPHDLAEGVDEKRRGAGGQDVALVDDERLMLCCHRDGRAKRNPSCGSGCDGNDGGGRARDRARLGLGDRGFGQEVRLLLARGRCLPALQCDDGRRRQRRSQRERGRGSGGGDTRERLKLDLKDLLPALLNDTCCSSGGRRCSARQDHSLGRGEWRRHRPYGVGLGRRHGRLERCGRFGRLGRFGGWKGRSRGDGGGDGGDGGGDGGDGGTRRRRSRLDARLRRRETDQGPEQILVAGRGRVQREAERRGIAEAAEAT